MKELLAGNTHERRQDMPAEEAPDVVGRMFQVASRVAGELRFAKNGYRLVLNNGAGAGQIVPHLHLHVMSGRRFAWPPG